MAGGQTHPIAAGEYLIRLNTVTVENVPVRRGHTTRIKAGFINIVSEGGWQLYDESKEDFLTSHATAMKIAVPVGKYQLKLGNEFFEVKVEDGQTVEF